MASIDGHPGTEVKDIPTLWTEAEASFLKAARKVREHSECIVAAWPPLKGPSETWKVSVDGGGPPAAAEGAFAAAGAALSRLAGALPLKYSRRAGILEVLVAERLQSGIFCVTVRDIGKDDAFVRMLYDADGAVDFATSRTLRGRARTQWDAACRKRLLREEPMGGKCVIEPGAAWFVEWLESMGATPFFSCEGHPKGFHVAFRAPYEFAHALAGAPFASVEIFRSGLFSGPGCWRLRLNREPETRAERDDLLRKLSANLEELGGLLRDSTRAPSD